MVNTFDSRKTILVNMQNTGLFVDGAGVELPNSAQLNIVPRQECAESYASLPDDDVDKSWVSIDETVLCASAEEAGIDSCRVNIDLQ